MESKLGWDSEGMLTTPLLFLDSTQISLRGCLHVTIHSRIRKIYLSNSKPNRITVLSLNWLFFPLIIHFRMLRSRTGRQNYCNDPTNRLWCFVASMPAGSWTCPKNPSKCDMQHKKRCNAIQVEKQKCKAGKKRASQTHTAEMGQCSLNVHVDMQKERKKRTNKN